MIARCNGKEILLRGRKNWQVAIYTQSKDNNLAVLLSFMCILAELIEVADVVLVLLLFSKLRRRAHNGHHMSERHVSYLAYNSLIIDSVTKLHLCCLRVFNRPIERVIEISNIETILP